MECGQWGRRVWGSPPRPSKIPAEQLGSPNPTEKKNQEETGVSPARDSYGAGAGMFLELLLLLARLVSTSRDEGAQVLDGFPTLCRTKDAP